MARRRGKERDSRAALLEAGWQLLLEGRAAQLSIESVLARAGLSKGTFFHFFASKQAFLDALCERIAEESWRDTGHHLERRDISPLARLDAFLRASRAWRSDRSEAIGQLWLELSRDENALLMNRVRALGIRRLAPPMARLLAEAAELGQLKIEDAEVAGELAVECIFASSEGSMRVLAEAPAKQAVARVLRRAGATLAALEAMLGAPPGSLQRPRRAFVARLAASLAPDGAGGPGSSGPGTGSAGATS